MESNWLKGTVIGSVVVVALLGLLAALLPTKDVGTPQATVTRQEATTRA